MKIAGLVHPFSLALTALGCSWSAGCVVSFSDLDSRSFSHQAERTETRALELVPGKPLVLLGGGEIRVTASADGRSELQARIRGFGRTPEEADQVLSRYRVEVGNEEAGTTVRFVGEPLRVAEGSMKAVIAANVDYVATVPEGTPIEASTSSGDIRVRGPLGACRLDTQYGSVEAQEVRGGLEARSGSGDVRAERVEGALVVLGSAYGEVQLALATVERITCESGSGDIDVEDVRAGSVELSTNYGSVRASRVVGALRARSGSGSLRLTGTEGALDAQSSYGGIVVEGVLADLRASAGSGDVRVRALAGSRPDPAWSLVSNYGGVTLQVPEDFGCELDARTSYGSVETDFPVLTGAGKREGDSTLRGKVGPGGGRVTLSSGSGNVALKKL